MRQTRNRTKKRRGIILAVCVLTAVLAVAGLSAAYTVMEADSDKILRNVYVDGIRIGGMKTAEAAEALDKEFSEREITLVLDENEKRRFSIEALGLMYKTDAIVGEAFSLGKSDSFLENVRTIFSSFFQPMRLSSSGALVNTSPGEELAEYIESYYLAPTESTYEINDDRVIVKNGMNGREVDCGKLYEIIESAESFEDIETVNVPVNILPFVLPNVDDIYKNAASAPKAPYGRNSDGDVTATVKVFNLDVAREIQKQNSLEGQQYEFIIDTESVAALDDSALYPEVLGEMTTKFDVGYTTRAANIRLAVGFLTGAELLPGEEFSFNTRIGEITAEKGYQVAKGYSNGTVVDSVGAGVCQISSTLYNAVLNANLQIVKRSNHSLPVSYLPLGQDAAISYPVQDFKFKNNSDSPIKILAGVDGGNLTVQIMGISDGSFTDVEIVNNTLSVIEPKTREVPDESLAPGKRVTAKKGSRGYVVESFRVVYKDGVEIKREALGKSTYKAQDKIINVGVAKEENNAENNQL